MNCVKPVDIILNGLNKEINYESYIYDIYRNFKKGKIIFSNQIQIHLYFNIKTKI